jgi:hypothetical protein
MAALKHIGMVRINPGGGNQESECALVDLKKLAVHLGASKDRKRASYVLPPDRIEDLRSEIAALHTSMQKKPKSGCKAEALDRKSSGNRDCANLFLLDSKRDISVSQKRRQRSSEETQTGSHLILKKTTHQNIPTPNPPIHHGELWKTKDSPDEDGPDVLLKWASDRFNAVIDDMRAHLLDTSRPPNPRFANGASEWGKFGFGSLAVYAAARRGEALALVLSASDPAAAHEGLKKYHRTWEPSLRKWYGCEVLWEVQETKES